MTVTDGREWIEGLPPELAAQQRLLGRLLTFCEGRPAVTELVVGCSLGRGAADARSDVDGAIGVDVEPGLSGTDAVAAVEDALVEALPELGEVVDVLRHRVGPAERLIRRVFVQFGDGCQLDVTVMSEAEIRRGDAAPDWVTLYLSRPTDRPGVGASRDVRAVSGDEIREWSFQGWCALIDLDKYLGRGSLWEAHQRLHEARHHIWALWAAAIGAAYPVHGLGQVLDEDPDRLPPGMDRTVAGLDADELLAAARASADVLTTVGAAAAARVPTSLPTAMADYVTRALDR